VAIAKRGQAFGFWALILTLAVVVMLAALGQPWVAGIVTTTAVPAILPLFATSGHRHARAVEAHQTLKPAVQEPPGSPPLPEGTRG